ncbi:MAG: circadian clock KaiB family protein [Rhodoferax sp.]|nr:circadian clock KaiB family protein [Rhodoferax sp.]
MVGPPASDTRYRLKLFVVGGTARTEFVIANFKRFCEAEFPGRYELIIVDVIKQPEIAETEKILATPTLIKESPLPVRRVIGDLSDHAKVLAAMGLRAH